MFKIFQKVRNLLSFTNSVRKGGEKAIFGTLEFLIRTGDIVGLKSLLEKCSDLIDHNIAIRLFNITLSLNLFDAANLLVPYFRFVQKSQVIAFILSTIAQAQKDDKFDARFMELIINSSKENGINTKLILHDSAITIDSIKNVSARNMLRLYIEDKQ